jgi:hypothetical protein
MKVVTVEGTQNKPRKIIHSGFRWETTKLGRGNRININLVRTQLDPREGKRRKRAIDPTENVGFPVMSG